MIAYTLSYYLHNYTLPILRTHVQACPPAAHIVFYFINAAYPRTSTCRLQLAISNERYGGELSILAREYPKVPSIAALGP